MWDADDDKLEVHTDAPQFSKPGPGFSLDDAFSEDDGVLDAALEFNPATIRAALARTLAAGETSSTGNQNGVDNDELGTGAGVSIRNPGHDRNGSVRVQDPDASVSTLDINASPAHVPGRAPEVWSRSTSYSHGYGYEKDSQDGSPVVESLENFSRISLSDSVQDLESIEISLEPSEEEVVQEEDQEGDTGEGEEGLFHAVHIDLSQGGKPRVEQVTITLPEPSNPHIQDRDGAQTPSPKHPQPPPLPSTSNNGRHAYTSSYTSTSTPTSGLFPNHRTHSQSVPDLPSPTTHHHSAEDSHTPNETNHIPPNSAETALSSSSITSTSSTTTSGFASTPNSTPPNSSQSEPPRRGHRPSRSVGPSALDKVISKTRPTFLPPKPKDEDLKHMADWEAMMKQSRLIGEFRPDSFRFNLAPLFRVLRIQPY